MSTFDSMFKRLEMRYPPHLEAVLDKFSSAEGLTEFVALIREYLPKHENSIMRAPNATAKMEAFTNFFSKDYFPLGEWDFSDGEYEMITREIPVVFEGISYEDYDDSNNFSPEWICMLALVNYPWSSSSDDQASVEEGISHRVPILDLAQKLAGDIVKKIPSQGFTPTYLHGKLDKTKYEGMAVFADWVNADTGCWQLDANNEDTSYNGGIEWNKENVAELKAQYPKMQAINRKMTEIETWLHEDLRSHFAELFKAISPLVPKEQLLLIPQEEEE